jgi:MFS family permease
MDLETKNPVLASLEASDTVDFQPADPNDPLQWSQWRKFSIIVNVSLLAAVGQMSSSMIAPAVPQIMEEFDTANEEIAALIVSVYLIGMVVGLLLLPGLSEVIGRAPVLWVSNVLFVAFAVGMSKATSIGMLIAFRLLLGFAASAPASIDGGIVGDLFPPEERGRAASVYVLGIMLGPTVGPTAGGYMAGAKGWRWVCWLIAIMVSRILCPLGAY